MVREIRWTQDSVREGKIQMSFASIFFLLRISAYPNTWVSFLFLFLQCPVYGGLFVLCFFYLLVVLWIAILNLLGWICMCIAIWADLKRDWSHDSKRRVWFGLRQRWSFA